MTCPACFHDNYSSSPGDDLEAACGCDCHEEGIDDSICPDCDRSYEHCICYGDPE